MNAMINGENEVLIESSTDSVLLKPNKNKDEDANVSNDNDEMEEFGEDE
jgi:hypothetical protein